MNDRLVDYGIQIEESDLRAHVCPLAGRVYVYRTQDGVGTIEKTEYKKVPVKTGNIVTAMGYPVPPGDIPGCVDILLEDKTWEAVGLRQAQTTSDKGKRACELVKAMIERGKFPIALIGTEIQDLDLQIRGIDIVVAVHVKETKIQVKCDFRGGGIAGVNNCTGNLFLQVAECNPYKQY